MKFQLITLAIIPAILAHGAQAGKKDQIAQALDEGNIEQAYQSALVGRSNEEGEPGFDFLYGLAAIGVGNYQEAVFALERVIALQPGNDRARVELGRALFHLGNHASAAEHFNTVLSHNPPPNVKWRINSFLANINREIDYRNGKWSFGLGIALGHDSNINNSTSLSTVDIPALGTINLDEESRAVSSNYRELIAEAAFNRPLSKTEGLFARASLKEKDYLSNDDYDSLTLGLIAGYQTQRGSSRLRVPVQLQWMQLDGEHYRDLATVGIDWSSPVADRQTMTLFAQGGLLKYAKQSEKDIRLGLFGIAYNHELERSGSYVSASFYAGREDTINNDSPQNGRDYYGIKGGFQWEPAPDQRAYLVAGWQESDHSARDPVFASVRRDQQVELLIGWQKQLDRHFKLKAELELTDNRSNITIYDFDRRQLGLDIHYTF